MSNDINLCTFTGRLGKDVDMRALPNGDSVASFSIAVGSSWKDKGSREKKEAVEWVNIVLFKGLANVAGTYLKKGDQVLIAGKMRTRKWQDKQGQDKYMTEIVASEMKMFGSGQSGSNSGNYADKVKGNPVEPKQSQEIEPDIPF